MTRTRGRSDAAALTLGIAGLFASLFWGCVAAQPKPGTLEPPSVLYGELFEEVALAEIYPAKDWVDAVALAPPATILAAWSADPPVDETELKEFVHDWFSLPDPDANALPTGNGDEQTPMRAHIEKLWPQLTRDDGEAPAHSSLLPLPHRYIVPGGRFREIYYWDTYFTMLGLTGEMTDLRRDMVLNFAHEIDAYGHVPNGNRTYYLSRSQPPFFYAMVALLAPDDPPAAYAEFLPQMKAEHAFWMKGAEDLGPGESRMRVARLPDGTVLNRYWDARIVPRDESYAMDVETAAASTRPSPRVFRDLRAAAESGWDFSSRWLDGESLSTIRTTQILPVDLNALLYGLERAIAAGCDRAGDSSCAARFATLADDRAAAMDRVFWDETVATYTDYDLERGTSTGKITAAMVVPHFTGAGRPERAAAVARSVRQHLLAPGGLLTTDRETGEQWDAPNGWAPLQWMAVEGVGRHDPALAETIAQRWLETVAYTYCETGKLVEKYDVVVKRPGGGGEYPTQDGFGWTNGVTIALLDEYPALAPLGEVTAVRCDDIKSGDVAEKAIAEEDPA